MPELLPERVRPPSPLSRKVGDSEPRLLWAAAKSTVHPPRTPQPAISAIPSATTASRCAAKDSSSVKASVARRSWDHQPRRLPAETSDRVRLPAPGIERD